MMVDEPRGIDDGFGIPTAPIHDDIGIPTEPTHDDMGVPTEPTSDKRRDEDLLASIRYRYETHYQHSDDMPIMLHIDLPWLLAEVERLRTEFTAASHLIVRLTEHAEDSTYYQPSALIQEARAWVDSHTSD